MKKDILIGALLACGIMFSTSAHAQQKSSKDEFKHHQKSENTSHRNSQKKAIKEARKEAKVLEKEGFRTSDGKLPLEKQLENFWQKQVEMDADGTSCWYMASSRAVGASQSAAALEATKMAKTDLAGQIITKVSQLIEIKAANNDMGKEEAAGLTEAFTANKSVISATLGRTIPLVEIYKILSDNKVEIMVTLCYSVDAANKVAIKVVRNELNKTSKNLVKELDKLGY